MFLGKGRRNERNTMAITNVCTGLRNAQIHIGMAN
jgi:hypothetical protein